MDTVNSVVDSDVTLMVDHAYADATDGYPAFNSMPGFNAAKVAKVNISALVDAYSTTLNFDETVVEHVKVGVDTASPYTEVVMYVYCTALVTYEVGVKVGTATNFVMFASLSEVTTDDSDSASATLANFGPGG